MDLIIATDHPDDDPSGIRWGIVLLPPTFRLGVVCRKPIGMEWEGMYVLRADGSGVRSALPHCFSLNDEAILALNNMFTLDQLEKMVDEKEE